MTRKFCLRLARALVAAAAVLLVKEGRGRWRREWEAELVASFRLREGGSLLLLRRALLCPADALAYRRHLGGSGEPSSKSDASTGKEPSMESLIKDLKFAGRSCRKQPSLTAVLLLTMTLGLGGNAAVFSLLYGVVLAPLPYRGAERIVHIWPARDQGLSKELLVRLEEQAHAYSQVAGISEDAFKMRVDGRSEMAYGAKVSAGYFEVLGAQPVLGRSFEAGDDRGGASLAVLSYESWQKRYGGDPGVLGRILELNGEAYQVVGVMEPGLTLPNLPFDLAVTHRVQASEVDWDANYLSFFGRLAPGATVDGADAELRSLAAFWADEAGVSQEWAQTASVVGLHESLVGGVRSTLYLLFGAAAFILLIVAANVANLLLARALSREQELSIRTALGASRRRLIRQLLTETTFFALAGGLLGLGLGH
ncbi:MAG: ABC transporter permease, partial [Acidobacteria bacterium]|nr:ABC transporter permease [Acidobacteriota bacterium]